MRSSAQQFSSLTPALLPAGKRAERTSCRWLECQPGQMVEAVRPPGHPASLVKLAKGYLNEQSGSVCRSRQQIRARELRGTAVVQTVERAVKTG